MPQIEQLFDEAKDKFIQFLQENPHLDINNFAIYDITIEGEVVNKDNELTRMSYSSMFTQNEDLTYTYQDSKFTQ